MLFERIRRDVLLSGLISAATSTARGAGDPAVSLSYTYIHTPSHVNGLGSRRTVYTPQTPSIKPFNQNIDHVSIMSTRNHQQFDPYIINNDSDDDLTLNLHELDP